MHFLAACLYSCLELSSKDDMVLILIWGHTISIASLFCLGHSKCPGRWVPACFWLLDMRRAVWTATASSIVFRANSVKFLSATCHFQFMLSEILTMIDGTRLFSKFLLNQKLISKHGCTQGFFKNYDFLNKCETIFTGTFRSYLDIKNFYSILCVCHYYSPMWKKEWSRQTWRRHKQELPSALFTENNTVLFHTTVSLMVLYKDWECLF